MRTKILNVTQASIMLLIITILVIVPILVMVPMVTQAQSTKQNDSDLTDQIDQLLTVSFPDNAPGAAVLVMRDGQVLLRKGYGLANLELGVPVAPDMVFRLGSVAKQFTAMAILMLSEEGKLALDDDITIYLPDYQTHGQTITIENLLTHTGGIKDFEFLPARLAIERKDLTLEELIALFKDEPLDFAPGENWSYSNSGYVLLGAIIEQVSGLSYSEFIQQRIFAPLGMKHSYYDDPTQIIPGRVAGYSRSAEGYANAAYMSMSHPYAAGALASSVDDLARWDAAFYTDKLIKQTTIRRAFRPYQLKNGESTYYGYGWGVGTYEGHAIAEHNGGINGFFAEVMRLPADKVYIAILSNVDNPPMAPDDLAFAIATMIIGKPYQDPQAITLPTSTLATYEGVYRYNAETNLVVRQTDDRLTVQIGGPPIVLVPLLESEFYVEGAPLRIKFVISDAGDVTEMRLQKHFVLWASFSKLDQPLPMDSVAMALDPAILTQYVGEYQLAPGLTLTVRTAQEKLFGQATGEAQVELLAEVADKFFLQGADVQIEFTRDDSGNVTGLVLYQSGQVMSGQKVK